MKKMELLAPAGDIEKLKIAMGRMEHFINGLRENRNI